MKRAREAGAGAAQQPYGSERTVLIIYPDGEVRPWTLGRCEPMWPPLKQHSDERDDTIRESKTIYSDRAILGKDISVTEDTFLATTTLPTPRTFMNLQLLKLTNIWMI